MGIFALGAIKTVVGFLVAFGIGAEDNSAAARRYLAAANSGEAIDEGIMMLMAGVMVGLVVHTAKKQDER